jgi:hypothetical protein
LVVVVVVVVCRTIHGTRGLHGDMAFRMALGADEVVVVCRTFCGTRGRGDRIACCTVSEAVADREDAAHDNSPRRLG